MQYQLLASDFDNTLVPFGEPKPRPAVVKAVKKLQAAGGRFVLSTGRGYCVVRKEQLGGIRFDYAITCNGACVVDKNGTIVAEHPLTNEEMYALVDFCEDYNYPLQFNYRDAYYAYCEYDALKGFYDAMPKSGLTCLDGEDQDRHLIDMPHAAFVVMPPQELAHFNEKFGHLNLHFMQVGGVGKDGWCCYDVVRGGMDKGVGLADLCEKIGLTLADAVAAGDSANDVGMLKAAGLGCCMSNGTPRRQGRSRPSHRGCAGGRPCRPHRGAVVRRPQGGTLRPGPRLRVGRDGKGGRVRMSFASVYDVRSRLEHGPARNTAKPALCRRRKRQGR